MTYIRLDPPIPLETTKGPAMAHFLNDPGDERDALWVCFLSDGQIWWIPNPQVRAVKNFSLERYDPEKPK